MAEVLVSALIKELASRALQRVEKEVRLVKGVDEDVTKLKSNLEAIQAVLEDAEKKQLADESVRNWLDKLKDATFDMDDVLDEWSTALLKLKIQREAENVPLQMNEKVCFSIASVFSCFTSKVNRITLRHDIADKIRELNGKLDLIASEKDKYKLNTTTTEQPVERPQTTSFIDESEIEGRDKIKDSLVSQLVCENSTHQGQGLHIIPIVGMGGLGKTSLAQLAYNNEKVVTHFDKQIWVCVSDPFDVMKVAKAIIESIKGKASDINELETAFQGIRTCIEGKRFLLVLDDVWTKDNKKWEQLIQPLKYGAAGSRILVTTRKEEVVIMMGAVSRMLTLEKLSEEECWLVFKRRAFLEREEEECKELEEIGKQIASKCKGLPLVAKTLGSLLCFKKSKIQWEKVLNSKLWKSEHVKEIFTPFLLSYYDLSAKEKLCFSYCSVFPKDHEIEKEELIEMWMSQGYFSHDTNSKEEGIECFENLAMRSFFQNFKKDFYDGHITHCKMHDIVHDFAHFLRKNECINLEVEGDEEELQSLDEKVRHLTLVAGSHAQFPALKYNKTNEKNLRTLFVLKCYHGADSSLFLNLTHLRTLCLAYSGLEILPESIGRLIHLRYLNLLFNQLKELPNSFSDLCNIQTLNLSWNNSLQKLPEGFGKLVNLKHLYLRACSSLEGLPKGFSRLTCLQMLDALVVPKNKEAYFEIGDLKMLKNLRNGKSLSVLGCGNLANVKEAEEIDLKNKLHVTDLELTFGQSEERDSLENDIGILEALEPCQNLASLLIRGYMGATVSPRWMMSLFSLRHLSLSVCPNIEILPSFGKLPSLNSLIINLRRVKKVGLEFLGITGRDEEAGDTKIREDPAKLPLISFPRLESLFYYDMDNWEMWEGSTAAAATETTGLIIMPLLKSLIIQGCPRLQQLPDFLETTTSLKRLVIISCEALEKCYQNRTGKEWAKISHVPKIEIGHKYVQKDGILIQEDNNNVLETLPSSSSSV